MSDVTAVVPAPAGYVVDFENPQRRGDIATYWCFGVGVTLAMLFTAQRVYVKLGLGTGWAADDCKVFFFLLLWRMICVWSDASLQRPGAGMVTNRETVPGLLLVSWVSGLGRIPKNRGGVGSHRG